MNIKEILKEINNIAYYREVLYDIERGDFSWEVTRTVWEMALQYKKKPNMAKYMPSIKVDEDHNLIDGSHRISTIYLLANYLDSQNPYWQELDIPVKVLWSCPESNRGPAKV